MPRQSVRRGTGLALLSCQRALWGLLEPDARQRASPVLRGAGRSNAPGLPGDVKACVRSPGARANQRHAEVRTFATTTNALLELRDWLIEQRVTLIAMEATGDYWRPPFYLLEDDLNIILVNPAHAKGLPGVGRLSE
jgi:hypothetical protein